MSAASTRRPRRLSEITEFLHIDPTQLLFRIRLLAPKKRKGRVRWVLALAFLAVAATLALDTSVREWLVAQSRPLVARVRARMHKGEAPAAAEAPTPAPVVEASAPVVVVPAAAESAVGVATPLEAASVDASDVAALPSASSAKPAKPAPKPHRAPRKPSAR